MTQTVGVHEAKTHLSRLLNRVALGEEVVITHRGEPVARLVPIPPTRRRLGMDRGRVHIAENFDAPLPDDLLAAFGQ